MRASSQAALARAQERWEPVLHQSGDRGAELGSDLFAVTDLLDSSAALRRALTDPSRVGEDKARLAHDVLDGRVAAEVTDLVGGLVRDRWSHEEDLGDAADVLAKTSVIAAADRAGRLEDLEDQSYRLSRLLGEERELRLALADKHATPDARAQLMHTVLQGKVAPETSLLAERAARVPRGTTVPAALRHVAELAADRRRHVVASVTAAVPLTTTQLDRLGEVLRRMYGRSVRVHVGVHPAVVGGLRVQVGDDVIDGTLAARLGDARRRLVG